MLIVPMAPNGTLSPTVTEARTSALGNSRRSDRGLITSGLPQEADIFRYRRHVSNVPCVDGSELARTFLRMQHWSVQPCVRPLGAVHMTAGHNALRGSGPGQKPAFDNALGPDRPALHYVLFALPTFTSRRLSGAISFTQPARRVAYNAHPWPSWPRPSAQSCWQVRWRRPSSGPALNNAVSQGRCLVPWLLA
jgi:hypothetical protein